ncbi:flagellar biosynthetic protein FliQ [Vibrio coralliilyticus]|uniref:flagellar biosynthetic protein FliQ n=1 Tax=Vibrio coralliilyticus TaxID=190893 RepID=UPI001831476C|nr:flagellar biosynthetic protein FliQ [Vibrio coralliilyticus]NUW68075.1 flagellar biosynthetic protein FliQ [Vibrio coralliilyticus]
MTVLDVTAACLQIVSDGIVLFSVAFVITGVVIGLLQTIFSVQDPGLPVAAKLIVFIVMITQFGSDIYEQFYMVILNMS